MAIQTPWKLKALQFVLATIVFVVIFPPAYKQSPIWMQQFINVASFLIVIYQIIPAIYVGWVVGNTYMNERVAYFNSHKRKGEIFRWTHMEVDNDGQQVSSNDESNSTNASSDTENIS